MNSLSHASHPLHVSVALLLVGVGGVCLAAEAPNPVEELPATLPELTLQFPEGSRIETLTIAERTRVAERGRRSTWYSGPAAGSLASGETTPFFVVQKLMPRKGRSLINVKPPRPGNGVGSRRRHRVGRIWASDLPDAPGEIASITRIRLRVWETIVGKRVKTQTLRSIPALLPRQQPPPDSWTWTEIEKSADTRIVYVSSSSGKPGNSGLSPDSPLASLSAGKDLLRDGHPDWLLLKRGDTWTGESLTNIRISGRSETEPLLISSYGTGPRPRIVNSGIATRFQHPVSHLAIIGLHMERTDESSYSGPGVFYGGYGSNLLIEDCYFGGFHGNLDIQGRGGKLTNFKLRGCVIVDAYTTGSGHVSGLFIGGTDRAIDGVDQILIEGCVFDHNGWSENVANARPNVYAHNVYASSRATGITFRNNISARASATGNQQRSGGNCEDNLFLKNPVAVVFGHSELVWPKEKADGRVHRNVVLDGLDIEGAERGFGIWLEHTSGVTVSDNIVAHLETGSQPVGIKLDYANENFTIKNNVVYHWSADTRLTKAFQADDSAGPFTGTNTVSGNAFEAAHGAGWLIDDWSFEKRSITYTGGNRYHSPAAESARYRLNLEVSADDAEFAAATREPDPAFGPGDYPDADRDIASYQESLGGAASLDAFLAEARKQSRDNWRPAYTAEEANKYIREGFGR